MLTKIKTMAQSICLVVAALTVTADVSHGEISHRVRASLTNRESSVRTTLGNRDVYLLHVTPRRGTAFDAIAVDSYPEYAEALPLRRLGRDTAFSVKLIRTPYCDRPIAGDGPESVVRCFTIEHGSLKMPKNMASESWWK